MDPRLPSLVALNARIIPSLSSFILSSRLREVMLATHGPSAASRLGVWSIRRPCSETHPLRRPPLLTASALAWGSRSRRMPGEPLDAPDDLPKESRCQVALGQLQDKVPGVQNGAATGLEQPLLEAREGPALDGERQDKPAQEIAEIVGHDPQEQAHLISAEPMSGKPGPVGGLFALLDPLLRRPPLVVEADDGPVRPGQAADDEAHPRGRTSRSSMSRSSTALAGRRMAYATPRRSRAS